MKRKYEGVYVLKMQGREESIDDKVSSITKELESSGATLEQIERIGRKEFAHENYMKQKHGYYVQFHFEAEPEFINSIKSKFKIDDQIMLQHYRRL
jgi:ribosomal protein S6